MTTQTKTAHSPGPWKAEKTFGGECIDYSISSGGSIIASTMGTTYLDEETDIANSRLIAAAPELLSELEHAHDMIRHYLKCGYLPHMSAEEAEQLVRNPDSAIQKARGGQ